MTHSVSARIFSTGLKQKNNEQCYLYVHVVKSMIFIPILKKTRIPGWVLPEKGLSCDCMIEVGSI